jgi:hypothetical protein
MSSTGQRMHYRDGQALSRHIRIRSGPAVARLNVVGCRA